MKKIITCYLSYSTCTYAPGLRVSDFDVSGSDDRISINALDVEFEVPDDFDPRPSQIKALEKKQMEAAAAFYALTIEIKRQIQELQALEMTA